MPSTDGVVMRIRSVGTVLASAALLFVPLSDAEVTAAAASEPAADVPASPEPDPIRPPAIPGMQRRIDVEMSDTAFSPTALEVRLGETIDFVFTNTGRQVHDAFIGDKAAQEAHEKEMREQKGAHDHAGHEGAVTVDPGETGAIRYRFEEPGTLEIGCHQPYHYAAGMKVLINVKTI
jgi:uncharacterized cupredoxin-like copper-binding protein